MCLDTDQVGFPESSEGGREEILSPVLDLVTKFRDEIRSLARGGASAKELLDACDVLRDVGLPELGVKLDDKEGGALWKLYDADELKKELERDREAKALKEAKAKIPPSEMFKIGEYEGLYSKYDDEGLPTHDKDGEELPKGQVKKLVKAQGLQKKAHETYLAKSMEKLAV